MTACHADIEALVDDFQRSGLRELHLRGDGVEIFLSTDGGAGLDEVANLHAAPAAGTLAPPLTPTAPAPPATAEPDAAQHPAGSVIVRAPYLGTFYRSPKPGSPVYVEVGSTVTTETELCLVEVMKLFTAVRADIAGTIHAVLAKDGAMVQADQPLFVVVPA